MDEPKTQVLWDPEHSKKVLNSQLRFPKPETIASAKAVTEPVSAAVEEPVPAPFVLRADAPEFVPKFIQAPIDDVELQLQHTHISGKPSAQNRLRKIKNSHNNTMEPSQAGSSSQSDNGDSPDMIRLKHVIASLINYPGQFGDLLMVFMETICLYFDDVLAMAEITELLVTEAINHPNFRYNGARLCWHIEQCCAEFRAALHLRCKKQLADNPNQQNVLLFIAELYTQLPHDNLYGALLIDSLNKLIQGGPDNIKCVCQALKLTGYSLEKNHKETLDEIFERLKDLSLPSSTRNMVSSVVNLRESNWGRDPAESSTSDSSEFEQQFVDMDNMVLYEMNGQTLSNEEQEFLNYHNDYLGNEDDSDDMDDDMQAAFEEFLEFSNQK